MNVKSILFIACLFVMFPGSFTSANESGITWLITYDGKGLPSSEWKAIGDEFGYVTSEACEIWAEQGLIPSGGDVRDYYRINTKREKIDPEWNDFVDENPELGLIKN